MWKLAIEDDQGHRTVVNLVRDEYEIGRAAKNTVRLTERNISREHAVLKRSGNGWVVEDRASYNGCFVNGVRVADPRPLESGDLIQVGDYRLEIADDAVLRPGYGTLPTTVPQPPTTRQSLTGQPDRLVMLVGPNPGMEFPLLQERVVIGRGEECDIPINHGSVSRVHAEILPLGDGRYEIIDRESANGVRVNGAELQRALLDARDTIELGDIVLKFIPAGMIYRPGSDESQQITPYGVVPEPVTTSASLAADPIRGSLFTPGKIAAVGGALLLALVLGVVMVGTGGPASGTATTNVEAEGTQRVLAEAKALAAQGQLEAAHVHITTGIPETSNARQSAEFIEIETLWADSLFAQAGADADRDRRRSLLERIAQTATVDSERRKRAADMVATLDAGGVDINQLPTAKATPRLATNTGDPGAGGDADAPDSPREASPPATTPEEDIEPAPAPSPPPTTKPRTSTSAVNQAMRGDRASQVSAINVLKAKAAAGTITDQESRMLRALCRQHGVADCAN